MRISDWSSDVCSSDLVVVRVRGLEAEANRIGVDVVVDKKVLPVVDRVVGVAVVRLAIRQEVEAVLRVGRQPRDVGRQVAPLRLPRGVVVGAERPRNPFALPTVLPPVLNTGVAARGSGGPVEG